MAIRFGQFLVGRGVISPRDLATAIDLQLQQQQKLGAVAMRAGALKVGQVMDILAAQDEDPDCPKFGALAVELGLLTHDQLELLLLKQRATRPPLGAILVDMGALDPVQLDELLLDFEGSRLQLPVAV